MKKTKREMRLYSWDDIYLSAEEQIKNDIGEEFAHDFEDIRALLALLHYRLNGAGTDYSNGLNNIFSFDFLSGNKKVMMTVGIVLQFILPVLWVIAGLKYLFRNQASSGLVFSNTFHKSRRYRQARRQIEESGGYMPVVTFYDVLNHPDGGLIKNAIASTFRLDLGKHRPFFFFGYSIAGFRLKKYIRKYYSFLYQKEHTDNGKISAKELYSLLQALRNAYSGRVNRLKKFFSGKDVKAYITVNQYNLRDLLIIHACNELGIRTIEQAHCAIQFSGMEDSFEKTVSKLCFAQEYAMWSEFDRYFWRYAYRHDNMFGTREELKSVVSGNLELTYEEIKPLLNTFPMERKLTFISAAVSPREVTEEELFETISRWRWSVFEGLRLLGERQKIKICIRYTPFHEMEFREIEIPVLEDWGFEISESVPENLMKDMCTSQVIMSTTSSVMTTALDLGRVVYRIEDPLVEYGKVDPEINDISVSDISELNIPYINAPSIDEKRLFNIRNII